MSKKLNEKHLNEHQCYEIILKLNKTNVLSIKTLAQEYNVTEGAIWKVWDNREAILERYALLSEKTKERTFRTFVGRFTELEDMLYI
jgi:transcriptional antiterminator